MAEEKKGVDEAVKLHAAVDSILKTPEGRVVWGHLARICGYDKLSLVVDPSSGKVFPESMVYNEGRRSVYLSLRTLASRELLRAVEFSDVEGK